MGFKVEGVTVNAHDEQGEEFVSVFREAGRRMKLEKRCRHERLREEGVAIVHPLDAHVEALDESPTAKGAQVMAVNFAYPDILDRNNCHKEGALVGLEYSHGYEWTVRIGRITDIKEAGLFAKTYRARVEMKYTIKF